MDERDEETEKPMTRRQAISIIESTFPADDHELGPDLLAQAKLNVEGWRSESDAVLVEYARLCLEEDRRQDRQAERMREERRYS
jgi:hypothetical protein